MRQIKVRIQLMDSGTLLVKAQDNLTIQMQNSKILHITVPLNSRLVTNSSQRMELFLVLNHQSTQQTARPLSM